MRDYFSVSRWLGIVGKELIQLKRDRLTFGMIVGIPIIQLVLFGFAINADPKRLPTAALIADRSEFSRSIMAGLKNSDYFAFIGEARDEADADAARQALAQADWRLAQRSVEAPQAGRINDTYYVVGDFVPAGSPVVAILPEANVKIRFYVPEPSLGRVRPGQTVTFACDGCGAPMNATISFIADRAEYTPPVLYSRENRAKLVYLVEARPSAEVATRLNAGQPVDVTLPAQQ
jgi:multidrug efflux pump subunit AcrA (membrane-fusion protein)